ncbi:MAG TPA: efflux RND transporter permease subunit [Gemmataceae bacterium]|jgi:multidrug efflux pump subunit AcrB|nr:efflux RND transporter permease subunit [Gemmataceae bacterium]
MWIVKVALKNHYFVVVLALMILVLGLVAVRNIPVDILPVFKAPAVQVLTYFQGMPASSIEKTITNRIERWVNQGPGVERIESKSVPGVSVVKLYFRDDIDPNAALTLTTSLAQGTLPTLPPNTLPPVTLPFDPTGTLPLGILTVSNKDLDEAHLKDVARIDVRNMLGGVPGCVAPVAVGGKDRTVLVYLRPKDMEVRNVSPLDVVKALQLGNRMITPGIAYFGKDQVLLDTNLMVDKVEELNEMPIRMVPGDRVYLKDIGHAEDAYSIQTSRVRITDDNNPNGRREVYVPIYRQQGASSLSVANGVKAHIDYMEKRLPPGTKLHFVMDQSLYVKEAIISLIHEGIIGAVLVSIMILIFLGNWRMTMIASMSIPLAILSAIICLYVTGNTINAMTLGGLALAIGPLVDDAIVVLENTHRHHSLGKSRFKAAFDGAVEVTIPVLVATSTTIIVLCPIALMPGMGGFLFRPLTLAVAFAMISSFILSRTLVPMLCARWLGEHLHPGQEHSSGSWGARLRRPIERGLNFCTRQYERVLELAMRHRLAVLTVVGLLFLGSLALTFGIGREFFPQVDAGQITIHVRAPSKSRLDESERRVIEVERFLEEKIPASEREMIVSEIGLDPDWSAAYSDNSGQQDTVIRLQLKENRRFSAQEYAIKLRHWMQEDPRRFADLRISFETGGMVSTALNNGASSPIDIQIEGGTSQQAERLAKDIRTRVAGIKGAADVRVLQRLDAPYLLFDIDRKKAADFGLAADGVALQLVAAMNSSVSINRNFWIDTQSGNQYFVAVQYPEDPNLKLEDVLNIYATGTNQPHGVKLGQLVTIRHRNDAVELNHVSLYRTFDVLVNTEKRDIGNVAAGIDKELAAVRTQTNARIQDLETKYLALEHAKTTSKTQLKNAAQELNGLKSIRWELRGEYERMNESFSSLGKGLIMAAILVYLLMVPLFRSYLGPFIIMFTVPLGLIGVLTMLFVTRTTLNVQSEMGVIFLVGIVVSNGVLLVDFANKQRKLGASVHKAITTAAAIRFRPIMMTFLATFLDLVPMAIGFGKGSEANVPLARAVVGGLLTSTFLTLIVVPILFTMMIRDRAEPEPDIDKELADEAETRSRPAHAVVEEPVLARHDGLGMAVQ